MIFFVALAIALSAALPLSAQTLKAHLPPPQSDGAVRWSPAESSGAGANVAALEAIYSDVARDSHPDLKGIVIVRDERLLSERYFNGDAVETLHDIRSATKSVTSLLMGMAIEKGLVHGVDDSIASYLPGLPKDGKEKITIRDLLTMRSGLDAYDDDASSPGNESRLDASSDWMRTVYAVPMKLAPGAKYVYCSLDAFLAGAILENVSHMPLDAFAKASLFAPLGIEHSSWRRVPIDRTTGQGNLSITTRDEAELGELVLDDGVVQGRRILSHDWIKQSLASQVPIADSDPYADFYGFMWYTKAEPVGPNKIEVHFASGNGGNKIYIVPSLRMVIAITSSAYNQPYGQRRSQEILQKVLAAVESK